MGLEASSRAAPSRICIAGHNTNMRVLLLSLIAFAGMLMPARAFVGPGLVSYSAATGPEMLFGFKAGAKKTAVKKVAKKSSVTPTGGLFGKKAAKKAAKKSSVAAKKVEKKFGVPLFLANGSINPEFKKREREQAMKDKQSKVTFYNKKSDALVRKGVFSLADFKLTQEGKKPRGDIPAPPPTGIFRDRW